MTTSRVYAEHEGELSPPTLTGCKCPACGDGQELHQTWESSDGAYVDCKLSCTVCKYVRWVDGDG